MGPPEPSGLAVGRPIMPPLTIGGDPLSSVVTPDGKHAVLGGEFVRDDDMLDLGEPEPGRRRP